MREAENGKLHITDEQRKAVLDFRENMTEETLWECVVAFQEYRFVTATGLPYMYVLKHGKNGITKELLVDRRKNSKSLSWGSLAGALRGALKLRAEGETVVERPKALGDIRGVSYIYPMLYAFGVIDVPEKFEKNMSVCRLRV